MPNQKKKLLLAGFLIIWGILFRTFFHLAPNVEMVTACALIAGTYLGLTEALGVPLVIMILSDLWLGNTNIFLFTWSAYLFIGLIGFGSRRWRTGKWKLARVISLSIVSSFWFYLWTNFGVWLLDSWGMYPKTISGLLEAYLFGLSFLRLNLVSNLFFVPLLFFLFEKAYSFQIQTSLCAKKIFRNEERR